MKFSTRDFGWHVTLELVIFLRAWVKKKHENCDSQLEKSSSIRIQSTNACAVDLTSVALLFLGQPEICAFTTNFNCKAQSRELFCTTSKPETKYLARASLSQQIVLMDYGKENSKSSCSVVMQVIDQKGLARSYEVEISNLFESTVLILAACNATNELS